MMTDDARRGLLDSMRLVTCLKFPFAAEKNSYLMFRVIKYVINGKQPRLVLGIKLNQPLDRKLFRDDANSFKPPFPYQ